MRPEHQNTPASEFVAKALDHASSLYNERMSRPTQRHADDSRIATETAETLFHLGRYRKGMIDQQARWRAALEQSHTDLKNLDDAATKIILEMKIACNGDIEPEAE